MTQHDEIQSMLTEEMTIDEIARRLRVPITSLVPAIYDLIVTNKIEIFLRRDDQLVYRRRMND